MSFGLSGRRLGSPVEVFFPFVLPGSRGSGPGPQVAVEAIPCCRRKQQQLQGSLSWLMSNQTVTTTVRRRLVWTSELNEAQAKG